MPKVTLALAALLCFCNSIVAQNLPRVDVFGGYSYLNIDTNNLTSRQSANGWEASVSGDVNKWLAIEGDFAGYYKSYAVNFDFISPGTGTVNANVRDYSYLGGPRLNYRPLFIHALFGGDHLTGSSQGLSGSQDSFAAAFGGGLEWKVAPRWAVRASGDYVLTHHNIFGPPGQTFTQNNFRASVGIVYIFGGHREAAPRADQPMAGPQCEGSSEAAALGAVGCSVDYGF